MCASLRYYEYHSAMTSDILLKRDHKKKKKIHLKDVWALVIHSIAPGDDQRRLSQSYLKEPFENYQQGGEVVLSCLSPFFSLFQFRFYHVLFQQRWQVVICGPAGVEDLMSPYRSSLWQGVMRLSWMHARPPPFPIYSSNDIFISFEITRLLPE